MCCAAIHNHAAGTQCCMTQHCDADQRANSAPNPSHSTVLGTHKHSRIPGCNLVNTFAGCPGAVWHCQAFANDLENCLSVVAQK